MPGARPPRGYKPGRFSFNIKGGRCEVSKGGEIVAEGKPEQVAEEPRSYTGGYLKQLLKGPALNQHLQERR